MRTIGTGKAKGRSAKQRSKSSKPVTLPLTVNGTRIGSASGVRGATANGALRVFCIPDVHAPLHHQQAWETVVKAVQGWKPDVLVQMGDFLDLAIVSTFAKDPRRTPSLENEVAAGNELLDQLDACGTAAGKPMVRVMLGSNHAERVYLFLQRQAPEFIGFVSYEDMLKLDKRGWLSVPYRQSLKIGECFFTHDVGRAGVNGTRQSLIDVGHNIVMGHQHRLNKVYQGTTLGKTHVAASLGWLGDVKHIDYMHRMKAQRDWQHGVGSLLFNSDGTFALRLHPIVQGRLELDGVVYG